MSQSEGRKSARLKALMHIVYNPTAYSQRTVERAASAIGQIEASRQRLAEMRYRNSIRGKREAAASLRKAASDPKNWGL
jgi:hypothetical protein